MRSSEPTFERKLAFRLSLTLGIVVGVSVAAVAYVGADAAGEIARDAAYDSTAARILGICRRIECIVYAMTAALGFSFWGIVRASKRTARAVVQALDNHASLLHNLGTRNLRALEAMESMRKSGVFDPEACDIVLAHLGSFADVARENEAITRNYDGGHRPVTRDIDFAAVVADVVDTEGDIARSRGVALGWTPPDGPVVVRGVESDLDSVVRNLVSNAVKYTPKGGSVSVSLFRERSRAVLVVADTGIGMSKATRARMFERNFRADWKSGIPGNGLGLALVRSIVVPCGGGIKWRSEPGKGTVFTVSLPLDMTRRRGILAALRRLVSRCKA